MRKDYDGFIFNLRARERDLLELASYRNKLINAREVNFQPSSLLAVVCPQDHLMFSLIIHFARALVIIIFGNGARALG